MYDMYISIYMYIAQRSYMLYSWALSKNAGTPLGPKSVPDTYIDPLGFCFGAEQIKM